MAGCIGGLQTCQPCFHAAHTPAFRCSVAAHSLPCAVLGARHEDKVILAGWGEGGAAGEGGGQQAATQGVSKLLP